MVGRGDLGKAKAAVAELSPSPLEPSTPPPSSVRETVAGWLCRYLSEGFCDGCSRVLKERIEKLASSGALDAVRTPDRNGLKSPSTFYSAQGSAFSCRNGNPSSAVPNGGPSSSPANSSEVTDSSLLIRRGNSPNYPSPLSTVNDQPHDEASSTRAVPVDCDDLVDEGQLSHESKLSLQQRERVRFSQVRRKKNFVLMERVQRRMVNVLEGLELHTGVFNDKEQKKIVDCVYKLQKLGDAKKLIGRTYSKPVRWMRGKGRVTLQFGCCYNYALDKDGNPPGIIQEEEVEAFPTVFKMMIRRLVRWHVLPSTCIPNSCIVNIYEEGDCIPPHIDHHDFLRPFCTVSFLSECNILFGSGLRITGDGDFSGPAAIPLPVGSVLILNGNGADVAKHCVPGVPTKRISITFRKMDDSRLPFKFSLDPDLQGIQPLHFSPVIRPERPVSEWNQQHTLSERQVMKMQHGMEKSRALQPRTEEEASGRNFHLAHDDFPPLGVSNPAGKSSKLKRAT